MCYVQLYILYSQGVLFFVAPWSAGACARHISLQCTKGKKFGEVVVVLKQVKLDTESCGV